MRKIKKVERNLRAGREGTAHALKLDYIRNKNDYINNLVNGKFFLARCNMIAEQLQAKKILESVDGCIKSREYMEAEYAMTKVRAIESMRKVFFAKQELVKTFDLTEKDILDIEEDYYNGKIIRDSYEGVEKKQNGAGFVEDS